MGFAELDGTLPPGAGRFHPGAADVARGNRRLRAWAQGDRGRTRVRAVIVIAFTATTTAVAGLLQFKQLVADISVSAPITHARITIPAPGHPQTILLIGSDHRAGEPFRQSNTDTMMLVHIDG